MHKTTIQLTLKGQELMKISAMNAPEAVVENTVDMVTKLLVKSHFILNGNEEWSKQYDDAVQNKDTQLISAIEFPLLEAWEFVVTITRPGQEPEVREF